MSSAIRSVLRSVSHSRSHLRPHSLCAASFSGRVGVSASHSTRAFSCIRQSIASPALSLSAPASTQPRRPFSSAQAPSAQEIEQRVLTVLRAFDKVPGERLSIEAQFIADLGLDSLDVVEVVMAIEEEFSVEIPDDVADSLKTPRQAAQYIQKALNNH